MDVKVCKLFSACILAEFRVHETVRHVVCLLRNILEFVTAAIYIYRQYHVVSSTADDGRSSSKL